MLRMLAGVRALLVEDDPATREALTEMLRLNGIDVRASGSSTEAMSVFEAFRPELLLCDIAMPGEDGYTLLGRIRALGPTRGGDVPALALTAFASAEDQRRAFTAGFQAHLAKPVDFDQLLAALVGLRIQAKPLTSSGNGSRKTPKPQTSDRS
jgi:CheY-like chemotaxis protein